ncbi:MAG: hypothetical protein NZM35_11480 [Chitinophagales bacterium]|nr:hypothetical protein [Chitinophagales bacterium]MDW8420115.1 hypothetical protein [Chitinophagales bacterium]
MTGSKPHRQKHAFTIEEHPWKYYIPQGAKALVIGTFPTAQHNRSFAFFYPNKTNRFWKIMAEIAGEKLLYNTGEVAVAERKNILAHLKLGITDMAQRVKRAGKSSLDEDLTPLEFTNLELLLKEHPTIVRLLFTSSAPGSSAFAWFTQYLKQLQMPVRVNRNLPKPWQTEITLANRQVEVMVLHSPSARAANRLGYAALVAMYRSAVQFK